MDLTFQVPMQYCSLQHQTLLPSPVTSTAGCCFCFGSVSSFFLELFLHCSPVAYWAPTNLVSSVSYLFAFSYCFWETPGHSWASLGQSLVGSLLPSPGSWCTQAFVCAFQKSVSPVLCKFWWLYGGVNGDLLQEGLCHTQVCCTQSLCPCSRPLLTHASARDS